VILIGWVMFRADNLDYFYFYIRRMFSFQSFQNDVWLNSKFWTILGIAVFFSFLGGSKKMEKWQEKFYNQPGNAIIISMSVCAILLFILSEANVTSSGFNPFIYFRF
jgi:alginate O-acetyltransferase complex protein AlgI